MRKKVLFCFTAVLCFVCFKAFCNFPAPPKKIVFYSNADQAGYLSNFDYNRITNDFNQEISFMNSGYNGYDKASSVVNSGIIKYDYCDQNNFTVAKGTDIAVIFCFDEPFKRLPSQEQLDAFYQEMVKKIQDNNKVGIGSISGQYTKSSIPIWVILGGSFEPVLTDTSGTPNPLKKYICPSIFYKNNINTYYSQIEYVFQIIAHDYDGYLRSAIYR
ncbi:hypothetical protein P0136_03115 [Lentisphaerota bacterium ZTH]|nr:hypothetical protein JYG24_05750 [Lentisphaerota bacterium]WET06992.1 hypothetical protein P0136_03115 [Lentisphaerota bacterium ZTH]